jgi:hypothetical protein
MLTLIVESYNYSNTLNRVNKLFSGDFGRLFRRVRSCLEAGDGSALDLVMGSTTLSTPARKSGRCC